MASSLRIRSRPSIYLRRNHADEENEGNEATLHLPRTRHTPTRKPARTLGRQYCYYSSIVAVLVILLLVVALWPHSSSNSLHEDGGILGRIVDYYNTRQYRLQQDRLRQLREAPLHFPTVKSKVPRKTLHAHRTDYLARILSDHQMAQTSIDYTFHPHRHTYNETTTIHAPWTPPTLQCTNLPWSCQRCLHNPQTGSLDACPMCPSCLPVALPPSDASRSRIPRRIFQVGTRPVSILESPARARSTNSWRSQSNFIYTFCNATCQQEQVRELPLDRLGAWGVGLLLVYRYGGVYADENLLLEVNLEALLDDDDNDSFLGVQDDDGGFSPLFVAASPGHPVIARILTQLLVFDGWRYRHDSNLLLLLSRSDTGATRITDPRRNLLVGTTQLIGWNEPLLRRDPSGLRQQSKY